jgi:hypothetical protein
MLEHYVRLTAELATVDRTIGEVAKVYRWELWTLTNQQLHNMMTIISLALCLPLPRRIRIDFHFQMKKS